MGYETAIQKAWDNVLAVHPKGSLAVRFLSDEYSVDIEAQSILSLSCNIPAKDFYAILILHYLASKLKGLPGLTGEWADFKEISALEGYGAAFRQRCIEPIIRKYGLNPYGIFDVLPKFPGSCKSDTGDAGVIIEAFEKVPVLITLWRADAEFAPDANMLFDRNIKNIFSIEDVAVLGQIVANHL